MFTSAMLNDQEANLTPFLLNAQTAGLQVTASFQCHGYKSMDSGSHGAVSPAMAAQALFDAGKSALEHERYAAALAEFHRVIDGFSQDDEPAVSLLVAKSRHNAGLTSVKLSRFDQALVYFDQFCHAANDRSGNELDHLVPYALYNSQGAVLLLDYPVFRRSHRAVSVSRRDVPVVLRWPLAAGWLTLARADDSGG